MVGNKVDTNASAEGEGCCERWDGDRGEMKNSVGIHTRENMMMVLICMCCIVIVINTIGEDMIREFNSGVWR